MPANVGRHIFHIVLNVSTHRVLSAPWSGCWSIFASLVLSMGGHIVNAQWMLVSGGARRTHAVGMDVDSFIHSSIHSFICSKPQGNLIGGCLRLARLRKTASRVDAVNCGWRYFRHSYGNLSSNAGSHPFLQCSPHSWGGPEFRAFSVGHRWPHRNSCFSTSLLPSVFSSELNRYRINIYLFSSCSLH